MGHRRPLACTADHRLNYFLVKGLRMLTHIRRHRSGQIVIAEQVFLPPKRTGGKPILEELATVYKDWSEVPNGSERQAYITRDCCGAIEFYLRVPLLDPELSDYVKKLQGHRWCKKCQSEHKPTKLAYPFSNRRPQARYSKGMRILAFFNPDAKAQQRKAELLKLTESLWLSKIDIS